VSGSAPYGYKESRHDRRRIGCIRHRGGPCGDAAVVVLKEIDRLRHVIRLRLNPAGEHDKKIERLIDEIPTLTDIRKRQELETALNDLTSTTQLLIKEEWEKVKEESKRGDIARTPPKK